MKVQLVFPPNRNLPSSHFGALPLLAGCLGGEGHECTVIDANLEVFDRLIRQDTIRQFVEMFEGHRQALRARSTLTLHEARMLQSMAKLTTVPLDLLFEAEAAAADLRDPERFRDPDVVNRAYDTLALALRTLYCLNPVYPAGTPGANEHLFGYVQAPPPSPIQKIIEDTVVDLILADDPDLVAVSIPFNEQTVEAFAILAAVKARAPHIPTIVGGAIISGYGEDLAKDPRFYRYADFAMPGEAEQAFPRFCTALETGGDLSAFDNLWRMEEGTIIPATGREISDLDASPSPDFSTLPVGRYLLPEEVVNYQTSRGCYYGKCTFCSVEIKGNFRMRSRDRVIADIEHIQRQTGLRHFIFWDPLTAPRMMRDVSLWNRERPEAERIFWGAESKFEKQFIDQDFTDMLYEGGGRFIQFGYESGSQRVLDLMVKGNDLSRVGKMLRCLENSRIAVSVQWFIGFPGATREEDTRSYTYLDDHRSAVTMSSYMGQFQISKGDDIYTGGKELYGIEVFQKPEGGWDYRYGDGTPHYDHDEMHAAYMARGDAEEVTRMGFYNYLTDQPERVREITGWYRGGRLPQEWTEMASSVPVIPDANYVATHDFEVFADPLSWGFAPAGDVLPKGRSTSAFVARSAMMFALDEAERQLVAAVDGVRTAAEIVARIAGESADQHCGADVDGLRGRLLSLVRRGVTVLPIHASATTEARAVEIA